MTDQHNDLPYVFQKNVSHSCLSLKRQLISTPIEAWNTRADSATSKQDLQVQPAEAPEPVSDLYNEAANDFVNTFGWISEDSRNAVEVWLVRNFPDQSAEIERLRAELNSLTSQHDLTRREAQVVELERGQLRERVKALEAERERRPMETAPKDGTPILALLKSGGWNVIVWNRDHWTNCLWSVQPTAWLPLQPAKEERKG